MRSTTSDNICKLMLMTCKMDKGDDVDAVLIVESFLSRDAVHRGVQHSGAYAVVRCPSVRPSVTFSYCIETRNTRLKLFHCLVTQTFYSVSPKKTRQLSFASSSFD